VLCDEQTAVDVADDLLDEGVVTAVGVDKQATVAVAEEIGVVQSPAAGLRNAGEENLSWRRPLAV